jgi:hypothetical protein
MRAAFAQFLAFPTDVADNQAALATQLTMPVLAIGGAQSFGATQAVIMRHAATQVTEVVIPQAGHRLMEEAPAATMTAIRAFLDAKPLTDPEATARRRRAGDAGDVVPRSCGHGPVTFRRGHETVRGVLCEWIPTASGRLRSHRRHGDVDEGCRLGCSTVGAGVEDWAVAYDLPLSTW